MSEEGVKQIEYYGPGYIKGVIVNNKLVFHKITWTDECTFDYKKGIITDGKKRLTLKRGDVLRVIDAVYENREVYY